MKKNLWAFGLCMALAACDGITAQDIEDAANQNEDQDQASALRLAIGDFWATVITSRTTDDFGAVTLQGTHNTVASLQEVRESSATRVSKVMAGTYVQAVDKNGYVIENVTREKANKFTRGGGTPTEGTVSQVEVRDNNVLFEFDRWVRSLSENMGGDNDEDPGEAQYPIAPRANALYTSDTGSVWQGVQAEAVGAANAVKITRVFSDEPYKIQDFFNTCFTQSPGTVQGSVIVDPKPECLGTVINAGSGRAEFIIAQEQSQWVGSGRLLKRTTRTETIILDEFLCGATGSPLNQRLNDCAQGITFHRSGGNPTKVIEETTEEVTKMARSADKEALPEIADAETTSAQ